MSNRFISIGSFMIFTLSLESMIYPQTALAHNPRVELQDWSSLERPYLIEDATVSFAMYGYLEAGDTDVFVLNVTQDSPEFTIRISVPVCGNTYESFHADYAIFGSASSEVIPVTAENTPDFPFTVPDDLVFLGVSNRPNKREVRTSRFTKRRYYQNPSHRFNVKAGSSILLYVYNEDDLAGDYMVTFGDKEIFFPPLKSEPSNEFVSRESTDVWPHTTCPKA